MKFQKTPLPGAFVVIPEPIGDTRGFFAEIWKASEAKSHGIDVDFNRTNLSFNQYQGTLRGLHSQESPYEEAKLVRCIRGAIFDVIVDIRPDSPSYRQWFGVTLSAENHQALYVPRGFLHGFQTLTDETEVLYQLAGTYHPESERGARFDDPAFDIDWPMADEPILSEKDQNWPPFQSELAQV